ncbi:YIP1 family protein [bacterium]|nr:YIP1 family protein [bacterium]
MKWGNLIGIYYQPAKVFEDLKPDIKWRWLAPLLIAVLAGVAAYFIIRPVMIPEIMAKISQNPDIPPEALERIQSRVGSPLGVINVVIFTPVVALLIGLVFWGIFSMLGGRTTFGHMFTATAWAMMVNLPSSLVRVPLILAQETIKVQTSLALVLPPEMEESFIFRLLAQVDIFTLWMLFVMATGYSVFTGLDRKKSYTAAYGAWGLWALVAAALGGMFKFGGM